MMNQERTTTYSSYYRELGETARERYKAKLDKLGAIEDLYVMYERGMVGVDWNSWPQVEYPDIYNSYYLIQTSSVYTGESLKAYKSLDAYNFCVNGWVGHVSVYSISRTPGTSVVIGRVKYSQRLSATPTKPWVAAKTEGTIVCAHCDCMAGLGEAYSHIAALLFTLERNTQQQKLTTCTSLPCSWLPPSFQDVPYSELAGIDFTRPQMKRKRSELSDGPSTSRSNETMELPLDRELDDLYKNLSKAGKPVLLSFVPGYSHPYVPLCASGVLPNPLTDLFKKEHLSLQYPELLCLCEEVFNSYTITPELAKRIEENTQDQVQSKLWFQQRAGRVTASRLKAAVCTNVAQPSQSLIKGICYPEGTSFTSKATAWGCDHEEKACKDQHTEFSISKNGLFIHTSYPFMGASPDGVVNCKCCGCGVVEIKCPYSCRNTAFLDKSSESTFFLEENDGKLMLSVYNAYYFQVQAQLKLSGTHYCDFVVWRKGELIIQRIYLDEPFISVALEQCKHFIKLGVLPELLGKWYSKEPISLSTPTPEPTEVEHQDSIEVVDGRGLWCYCRKGEVGEMIACDDEDCSIVWFHTTCLHLYKIAKGKWFCPESRKKKKK